MTLLSPATLRHWQHPRFRSRAVALAIAILFELLFILALLIPFGEPRQKRLSPTTSVFNLPTGKESAEKAKQPEKAQALVATKRPDPALRKPVIDATPPQPKPTPNMVPMTSDDFAAANIGKLPRASTGAGGSKGTYGPGDGPGGRTLYPADWYRKPRNGALAEYLPYGAPNGAWAMIACRPCPSAAKSVLGISGPATMPPRINGRPQIGAWVRIRFDFTERTDD